MKFKLALWILGFKLERASRNNPRFIDKLKGQDLIFEIGARDGYARHFVMKDQKVLSYPGRQATRLSWPGPGADLCHCF